MFESLSGFFKDKMAPADSRDDDLNHLQVATCALLLEAAHADNDFTEEEEKAIAKATTGLQADDIAGIVRFYLLILNPHGLNADNRGFGAESVAAGGPDFNLFRKSLALYLVGQGFKDSGGAVCAAAGHAHMHFDNALLLAGQNLVAEPLELSDG